MKCKHCGAPLPWGEENNTKKWCDYTCKSLDEESKQNIVHVSLIVFPKIVALLPLVDMPDNQFLAA